MTTQHRAGATGYAASVLVAYASKHRGTVEIAEEIGERLQAAGHRPTVAPLTEVGELTPFEAVVLGSAVYEENWLPEAEAFLAREFDALGARPLWLFSSGVLMTLGLSSRVWLPTKLRPISRALKPRGVICFGGKLEHDRLSREDRRRNPQLLALEGDYRDWEVIDAWTADISRALTRLGEERARLAE
jgi:menaquinone-dependent protoporphyrinogen oxidase